jgi:hypothetical protein
MSTISATGMGSYYRPKKYIRPLRRQLPVFWLVGGVVCIGLICLAIAWRNLSHERLERNVSVQWSKIERLDKEISQVHGLIKNETAHNRISKWARERRGWRTQPGAAAAISILESDLTVGARREVTLLDTIHE